MERFKIALDVDDTIAGFYSHMCKQFKRPELRVDIWDGKVDCKWIADEFPDLFSNLEFWNSQPVLSSPQSITFDFDYYLTAFPEDLKWLRRNWLLRNGYPDKPVICTDNKVEVMLDLQIDVLVDDKPSTIKKVREADLIGIQFVPSYMNNYDKNDPFTISHLSQVPGVLNIK
jgi:hypothetical protein